MLGGLLRVLCFLCFCALSFIFCSFVFLGVLTVGTCDFLQRFFSSTVPPYF